LVLGGFGRFRAAGVISGAGGTGFLAAAHATLLPDPSVLEVDGQRLIAWDEALELIAERLKAAAAEWGPESILPRLTIVALMVFFPVMINTIRGLTNVEPAALELLSSYAASERQTMAKLRAPNALPYWFTALRIATTLSVIGAVVGEFFGGPLYSLGIYITLESGHSRYPTAWAAIVVACAMGIGLYLAAVALERLVVPWRSAREMAR